MSQLTGISMRAIAVVIPAKARRKKKRALKRFPNGILRKISGRTIKVSPMP